MKTCKKCNTPKDESEFAIKRGERREAVCKECRSKYHKEWYSKNRERRAAIDREWSKNNPEKRSKVSRTSHLRRQYSLTPEQYDLMFTAQDGKCWICRQPPMEGKKLFVDHDHETGRVRSLLCLNCNAALGHLKDSTDLFSRAIEYLKIHGK